MVNPRQDVLFRRLDLRKPDRIFQQFKNGSWNVRKIIARNVDTSLTLLPRYDILVDIIRMKNMQDQPCCSLCFCTIRNGCYIFIDVIKIHAVCKFEIFAFIVRSLGFYSVFSYSALSMGELISKTNRRYQKRYEREEYIRLSEKYLSFHKVIIDEQQFLF